MIVRRLLLGLSLLLPLSLPATTVRAPSFDSLVSQADYIVRATVTSVTSEWQTDGNNTHIITKVTLAVSDVIKGTPPQPLVLEMLGGTVDGVTMRVEGAPRFNVGEEHIFFIHGNGTQFTPLVGLMYGSYPVFADTKTGNTYMLRSNGMPLYSEQDVSLPMNKLSAAKAPKTSAQPMSPEAFASKIRNAVNTSIHAAQQN
jgi:hypothetical protein